MFRLSRRSVVPFVTLAAFAAATPAAGQDGRTDLLARSGDAAPDGNGAFDGLDRPALNDSGQAAFRGFLTGTAGGADDEGVFRGDGGALTQLARTGQAAPDGNGTYFTFFNLTQNAAGQAAFEALLTGTAGGNADNFGVFRGDGGAVTQVARGGQTAPDGNGTYFIISDPALNASGQVAFRGTLTGTAGGSADNSGVFRGDGGALTQVAREGQAAPDGNGTYRRFRDPALNASGQAAFRGTLRGTAGGSADDAGVFRGDGGAVTQLARAGQAAPDGNGAFTGFGDPSLNDAGQAAFFGLLTGTAGGSADDAGVFRGDGGTLTQVARAGQAAPDGNGTYSSFRDPALNAAGQAAFFASLTGTAGGSADDEGVFRGDGGAVTQLARTGQAAPDGNGTFSSFTDPDLDAFTDPALNASGQAAFVGFLTGTAGGSADVRGVFTGDGVDLLTVVREGDALAGGVVASMSFDVADGLNDFGQVAYSYALTNGDEGVARWTPDLSYRGGATGSFDTPADFTLGLDPTRLQNGTAIYDVFLDPAAGAPGDGATIAGSNADFTLKSLTIGGGGGDATLNLDGGNLTVAESLSLADGGTLAVAADTMATVIGDLTTAGASALGFELDDLDSGLIAVAGDVLLGTNTSLLLDAAAGFAPVAGQSFLLVDVGGTLTGQFLGLNEGDVAGTFGGTDLFITYAGGDGNDVALFAGAPAAVPEPGTWALIGLAACGGGVARRRRRRAAGGE